MAGVRITIDDEAVNAALSRIEAAGRDTRPLMEAITGAMLFSVQRRFETETDPDGTPWAPLRPRTAARRIRGRPRGTEHMLRVTNRLYSSITGEATDTQSTVGTNLAYAAAHQAGATIRRPARSATVRLRKVGGRTRFARRSHKRARDVDVTIGAHTIVIPARPYLGFSEDDRAEIGAIIEEHFGEAAGGGSP